MNLPHHRLFVLGAGFSAPAGLPLAKGLLESVREVVRYRFQRHDWEGPLEQEIEEWTSLYPGQPVDLERVLAYSHRKHYLRLLGSKEYFADGSRSIVAARTAIQEILIQATPRVTPDLYRAFAEHLSPDDVVITFNYDTLLEQALDDIDTPYTLTPEWWLARRPTETRRGYEYVDVLKLHGSIDWYDRHYHDEAIRYYTEIGADVPDDDPIFGPAPSVPTLPLSHGLTGELGMRILSRVFRIPNHAEHFPIESDRFSHVVPFILPPAYDKLLGHDIIADLWYSLHHTLDAFSAIIIVGYSMPPYDSYAYEALGRLFVDYQQGGDTTSWEQRRVPIQLITLADSEDFALKSIPFLNPEKTHIWHQGFSDESLNWIDWGDGAD